jgi:hypothetical protein
MSGQIKLKAASLGGDITLTPTDTASNLVVTIPAGTSTLVTNATLPTQLNASGSAPIYASRAWVNFNGTGTVAIRASGNVSSITDNGTGRFTVNLTTAMSDANYAALISSIRRTFINTADAGISTSSFTVASDDSSGNAVDVTQYYAAIFR